MSKICFLSIFKEPATIRCIAHPGPAVEGIFKDINAYSPGLVRPFQFQLNPNDIRAQIRPARRKLQGRIDELNIAINGDIQKEREVSPVRTEAQDKRRVFVVYGRNMQARNALFTFLSRINLDPIEWEEAIAMTGEASAFTGSAIEIAFKNAQAAVILLTGDDLARLGRRYLSPHDEPYEKISTPQPRPNVLFEAGMAFGLYPERTVIVALGKTRPFSDIAGRHIIFLSNNPECRQKLAGRLKIANCLVKTDYKEDWLTAGDFDSALHNPDIPEGKHPTELKITRIEAQNDEKADVKHKIWIEIRNDSENCPDIRFSHLKQTPSGIEMTGKSGAFQIRLGGLWCPEHKGVERLQLPPGESCQTWIKPADQYSMEDLHQRCQSEGRIGSLVLLVNGAETEFVI